MRRRDLVAVLGGTVLAWPFVACAQRYGKTARLAALFNGSKEVEKQNLVMLMRGLEEHGYTAGRNIALDLRYANSEIDRIPEIVRDMIAGKPDVMLLQGSQAIWAGKKSTTTIPIVMISVADPVRQGLVASLGRPGENITGFSIVSEADISKRLQLLMEILPQSSRFSYLTNLSNPAMPPIWRSLSDAAKKMDIALQLHDCRNMAALDAALAAIAKHRPDGVLIEADALLSTSRKKIIDFLLREKLPSMWRSPFGAPDGGLMSYGSNFTENWRGAVRYVDRILKGANPGELPVEQPTHVRLVINLNTAQQLGIKIPRSVLVRADRVIQ